MRYFVAPIAQRRNLDADHAQPVVEILTKLALDNTLLSRFYVQSEFRTAADLVDRISGGSGPGGLKAVAPTGTEPITIVVTEDDAKDGVSILGEKLSVVRMDGSDNFNAPGRPIAVISNVMLEYRPAPPPKPAPARRE